MPINFVEESAIDFQEESASIDFTEDPQYLGADIPPKTPVPSLVADPSLTLTPARSSEELAARNFYNAWKATGQMPTMANSSFWDNFNREFESNILRAKKTTVGETQAAIDYVTGGPEDEAEPVSTPGKTAKVITGVQNAVVDAVNSFRSPLGIATLGLGTLPKAAQSLLAGAFAAHMSSTVPEQAKGAVEAIKAGDTEAAARHIAGTALTGAFVGLAGKHAVTAGKAALSELKVEAAKEVGPATEAVVKGTTGVPKASVAAEPTPALVPRETALEAPKPELEAPTPVVQPVKAAAKAATEVMRVAKEDGQRDAKQIKEDLITEIQTRLQKAPSEAKAGDTVTIEIPGDGVFTVKNNVEALSELLGRAKRIKTDTGKPPGVPKAAVKASHDAIREFEGAKKPEPEAMGLGAATPAEFELKPQNPTSIKNAVVDQERAARGLPPAMEPASKEFGVSWEQAMAKMDADYLYPDRLIAEMREKPRAATDTEVATLLHRQVELRNLQDKAMRELAQAKDDGRVEDVADLNVRVDILSNQLLDLFNIDKAVGTENARGLNARKMLAYEDFSLAKMELEKRAAKGGEQLTDAERAEVVRVNKEIEATQRKHDEHVAVTDETARTAATDKAISNVRAAAPPTEPVEVITAQLKEKFAAGEADAMTSLVQKLARHFVEKGIKERDPLIAAVHDVVKTIDPTLELRDTMDMISGYGKYRQLSKDQISKELRDLKGQMQQVAKLKDMEANRPPLKTGTEQRVPSVEERRLTRLVNEAKNKFQIPITDEATQLKSPLDMLKTRLRNRTNELEDKLARKDFTTSPRRVVQLDAEAQRLHFKAAQTKAKWHEALMKDRLARRSVPAKIIGGIGEVLNTTRAILTSLDLSAVLRQGGFITLGHPIRALKAFPAMFRALRSEAGQHAVNQEIMARKNYPLYQQSKLYLAEHGQKLSQMEEAYMSRWADTPIKIKGVDINPVAASQRAYVTFLNKLRADSFDSMANTLSRTGEVTPHEAKAIANFINVATGRGKMGVKDNAAVGLSTIFFAPRYVASRFQLLGGAHKMVSAFIPGTYNNTRRAQQSVAKEYARFLIGAGIVYGLGTLAGGEVETDVRSSDFGKLRFGDTRLDPMAGLLQVTVLTSRIGSGETKELSGKVVPIVGQDVPFGKDDAFDVGMRFLRTKLAPVPAAVVNLRTGEDVIGQPTDLKSITEDLLVPLALKDILKAMEDQGVPRGTALAILSIFGMGLQTYDR